MVGFLPRCPEQRLSSLDHIDRNGRKLDAFKGETIQPLFPDVVVVVEVSNVWRRNILKPLKSNLIFYRRGHVWSLGD